MAVQKLEKAAERKRVEEAPQHRYIDEREIGERHRAAYVASAGCLLPHRLPRHGKDAAAHAVGDAEHAQSGAGVAGLKTERMALGDGKIARCDGLASRDAGCLKLVNAVPGVAAHEHLKLTDSLVLAGNQPVDSHGDIKRRHFPCGIRIAAGRRIADKRRGIKLRAECMHIISVAAAAANREAEVIVADLDAAEIGVLEGLAVRSKASA